MFIAISVMMITPLLETDAELLLTATMSFPGGREVTENSVEAQRLKNHN